MNYTELSDLIKSYTQNYETTFVATIPAFVKQAEQRIYNTVQLPVQRRNQTGQCTSGNQYLALPVTSGTTTGNWLSTFSIAVLNPATNEYEYLLNKDVNFIRQAFPSPAELGKPGYYAIFDQNTLILGPTPDVVYTLEMHYNAYPPSIVDSGTSWLGDNFDTVLLYGSLVQAYIFMKGEADVLQMYDNGFKEALMQLKRLSDGLDRQDAYRSGQARIPVN